MNWESVIGLEIHAQLQTKSKIFSGASVQYGAKPNTQACAIDLGMPGVLPVLNKAAVIMAIKFGLATGATIPEKSIFTRKNYFYPDLPKGYQISQHEQPIVEGGSISITVDATQKRIGITRAHLEEDAGKSLHEDFHGMTGIDLNRAGTPLLEIVSEPELYSAKEAVAYMRAIHTLVRYLDICDGNMQEGSFRCDANISIRPRGEKKLGIRTEIKNINSFRFVEKAINYEIERQISLLERGDSVIQETLLYDANKNQTRSMRSKEEAADYRYFPDPDLLPVAITQIMIEEVQQTMPELPEKKYERFAKEYNLSEEDIGQLLVAKELADYFEEVLKKSNSKPKLVANWITGTLTANLNKAAISIKQSPISPKQLSDLLRRISNKSISNNMAKTIFDILWQNNGKKDINDIIEEKGLSQVTDLTTVEKIIDEIINAHPVQLAQYRSGKDKVFGFFVGKVMQATQGKANPQQVNQLLKEKLTP